MSAETGREEPRHIFLEPECCADPSVGRCWAAHNEWPLGDCAVQAEATQYVRADLVAALERERDAATARAEAAEVERDAFKRNMEAAADLAARYGNERDAATAERDKARAALKPFVVEADRIDPPSNAAVVMNDCEIWQVGSLCISRSRITYGDLRAARAALGGAA